MRYLDTSAIMRYYMRDDESKAAKVSEIIDHEPYVIIESICVEIDYTLRASYRVERADRVQIFEDLLLRANCTCTSETRRALKYYTHRSTLSFADCLLLVHCAQDELVTFDQDLAQAKKAV